MIALLILHVFDLVTSQKQLQMANLAKAAIANVLLSSFAHWPYAHSMRVPIPCSAGSLTSVLANDEQQNRMLFAPEVAGGLKRAATDRPG